MRKDETYRLESPSPSGIATRRRVAESASFGAGTACLVLVACGVADRATGRCG